MPIRPERRDLYPKDWKAISHRIRFVRAKGRCEFRVDAQGIPQIKGGKRCTAKHGKPHPITGSNVVLTTAHLNHDETDCRDENLKAGCQKCHNAWDAKTRAAGIKARRAAKNPQEILKFAEVA